MKGGPGPSLTQTEVGVQHKFLILKFHTQIQQLFQQIPQEDYFLNRRVEEYRDKILNLQMRLKSYLFN